MEVKAHLMDETAVMRSLARITHEIIEKNHGTDGIMLVGIKRRGVPLAEILAANIQKFEGAEVPVGNVDIFLYRDDLTEVSLVPACGGCQFPKSVTGKVIVLVDDVIYTGRTARAAMEAVFRAGRPRAIQLAVLIDRGHRELPMKADYVGKNVPTSKNEIVQVMVEEIDGETGVVIADKG